jgi:hypothetical protein
VCLRASGYLPQRTGWRLAGAALFAFQQRTLYVMLGKAVRPRAKIVTLCILVSAGAAVWAFGRDEDAPNPHLRAFACERGFKAEDWTNEGTREMTAQSIDQCGWFDEKTRRETFRLLGKPYEGGRRNVSYSTGYDDAGIGTYSYLDIMFANGRVRDVEATYGE